MEIEKTNKYFWVEKKNDFVKLCFDFLPENDEYIADIEETEALIKRKIELKRYRWFAGKKNNEIIELDQKDDIFSNRSSAYFLVPLESGIGISDLQKILLKYDCNFRKSYETFYYDRFASIQKEICNSIIISHTVLLSNKRFVSMPVDHHNICVYSLDIYMEGIDKIEW